MKFVCESYFTFYVEAENFEEAEEKADLVLESVKEYDPVLEVSSWDEH